MSSIFVRQCNKHCSVICCHFWQLRSEYKIFADYHNNDAAITKHLLLTNESAKNWLQENDILIVDRGFSRCCRFSGRRVQRQDAILS